MAGETFRVEVVDARALGGLLAIPSRIDVTHRLLFRESRIVGMEAIEPAYEKDYDSYLDDRLDGLADRYEVEAWGVIVALDRTGHQVGGMVLAIHDPSFELLAARADLGHVVDLRVHPLFHRQGVGKLLWLAAEKWAREQGIVELRVETQDVNVGACAFYHAMGCEILRVNCDAYPIEMNEVQVILSKQLSP